MNLPRGNPPRQMKVGLNLYYIKIENKEEKNRKMRKNINISKCCESKLSKELPKLKTLVLDTFYPDCQISVSTVDTFDFLLNPLFWIYLLDSDQ